MMHIDKGGLAEMVAKYSLAGIVVLVVCLLSLNLAAGEEIENVIMGGDFENGDLDKNKWTLQVEGAAACTLTVDEEEAAEGESSLFAEVASIDNAANWVPWIWQTQMIKKGKTYTLSVFLKAEEDRDIALSIRDLNAPKQEHTLKTVLVGTEWEEHWATLTSPKDVAVKVGVRGGPAVNFWMDGFRFYEGEYEPTEIGGPRIAVDPRSKLSTTWATLKRH